MTWPSTSSNLRALLPGNGRLPVAVVQERPLLLVFGHVRHLLPLHSPRLPQPLLRRLRQHSPHFHPLGLPHPFSLLPVEAEGAGGGCPLEDGDSKREVRAGGGAGPRALLPAALHDHLLPLLLPLQRRLPRLGRPVDRLSPLRPRISRALLLHQH